MVEIDVIYEGDLHTKCIHQPSGAVIFTDAPKDNHGKGEAFSPTDLLGAALGSCILTIMGIQAKNLEIDLKGTSAKVTKEMSKPPAPRLPKYKVEITVQSEIPISSENKMKLENAAHHCPVHRSLQSGLIENMVFYWE
jgi:putative redox protein